MKLRMKDRRRLQDILHKLERGRDFLMGKDTLLCRRRNVATTTLDFTNAQGEICVQIDREIGSELALLHTGIQQLQAALDEREI